MQLLMIKLDYTNLETEQCYGEYRAQAARGGKQELIKKRQTYLLFLIIYILNL